MEGFLQREPLLFSANDVALGTLCGLFESNKSLAQKSLRFFVSGRLLPKYEHSNIAKLFRNLELKFKNSISFSLLIHLRDMFFAKYRIIKGLILGFLPQEWIVSKG